MSSVQLKLSFRRPYQWKLVLNKNLKKYFSFIVINFCREVFPLVKNYQRLLINQNNISVSYQHPRGLIPLTHLINRTVISFSISLLLNVMIGNIIHYMFLFLSISPHYCSVVVFTVVHEALLCQLFPYSVPSVNSHLPCHPRTCLFKILKIKACFIQL